MRGGTSPVFTMAGSPRNFHGLALWLRADMGITLAGNKVSSFADQSGSKIVVVQAVDAARPTWSATSGPNRRAGITFDGTQTLQAPSFSLNCNSLDVFVVMYGTNVDPLRGLAIVGTGDGSNSGAFAEQIYAGDYYDALHFDAARGIASDWESSAVVANSAHVLEFQHDLTVSTEQTHVLTDGVLTPQTMYYDGNCKTSFGTLPLTVGGAGAFHTLTGTISEIIIFKRLLNTAERSCVIRCLGSFYAIAVP